jgi:hypothetical protein
MDGAAMYPGTSVRYATTRLPSVNLLEYSSGTHFLHFVLYHVNVSIVHINRASSRTKQYVSSTPCRAEGQCGCRPKGFQKSSVCDGRVVSVQAVQSSPGWFRSCRCTRTRTTAATTHMGRQTQASVLKSENRLDPFSWSNTTCRLASMVAVWASHNWLRVVRVREPASSFDTFSNAP